MLNDLDLALEPLRESVRLAYGAARGDRGAAEPLEGVEERAAAEREHRSLHGRPHRQRGAPPKERGFEGFFGTTQCIEEGVGTIERSR